MTEIQRTLTIHYTNGSKQIFSFPPQSKDDTSSLASKFQRMLDSNYMSLNLGDRLLIVAQANIQSIEISPPPEKMPPLVLNGVKLIAESK